MKAMEPLSTPPSSPEMQCRVVVFPAPLAPISATISPAPIVRVMPFSARIFPYEYRRSESSRMFAIRHLLPGTP